MSLGIIALLALIQGLTEFLPISSSAHLILAPHLFGFADQGLAFDLAVHLGTLLAVLIYFRQRIILMLRDWLLSLVKPQRQTEHSRLAWLIILATLPVVIAGVLLKSWVENELRSPLVIASTTVLIGALILWADWTGKKQRSLAQIQWRDALFIGLAQVLALIPGTSRSGITMAAALRIGYSRQAASQFSFLLAIPTLLAAALWVSQDLILSPQPVHWLELGLGSLIAFIAAYLSIHFFLHYIERIGLWPFMLYRFALGAFLFWYYF